MSDLTAGDLSAYATLLRLEHEAGQAVTLTQPSLWDFMAVVDNFVRGGYRATSDAQLRGWCDTLLHGMIDTQTSYAQSILGIYIATAYGRWLQTHGDIDPRYWAYERGEWVWPDTPGYLHEAVQNTLWAWDTTFPSSLFGDYEHINQNQRIKFAQDVVDPAHWNDARKLSAILDGFAVQQAKGVHAIATAKALKDEDAIPLLHQLIGSVTSSQAADVRLAGSLVATFAPSNEYPNDTFINQLVYFVLMRLADPIGSYGWPNAQLQTFVKSLALHTTDPGSVAIRKSLDTHARILVSAASYPMVDPYVPAIGFTVRQTDTLAALNAALKDIGKKAPVDLSVEESPSAKSNVVALPAIARMQGGSTYSLTASDLGAFPALIRLENVSGPSQPVFNDATTNAFIDSVDDLSNNYGAFNNALVRGWIDQLYKDLLNVDTNYNAKFPQLYLAVEYGRFWVGTANNMQSDYPDCFQSGDQAWLRFRQSGGGWSDDCNGNFDSWHRPPAPQSWADAINGLINQWGDHPPPNLISLSGSIHEAKAVARSLINVGRWTTAAALRTSIAALWTSQSSTLATLIKQTSIDRDTTLFVLFLSISLGTSTAADQAKVASILSADADSPENPNDTFADQLIYYILMQLADPRGAFGWNNGQLQGFVNGLIPLIAGGDPGATLLRDTLAQQAKLLNSATSYPMTDPYNPSIGFNQRLTDTLSAINKTWAALPR